MIWEEIRARYPDEWLLVEALDAHSDGGRRILDNITVVEVCPDGAGAFGRYRQLHAAHADRELYFVHTGNAKLEIDERPWVGIRWDGAAGSSR